MLQATAKPPCTSTCSRLSGFVLLREYREVVKSMLRASIVREIVQSSASQDNECDRYGLLQIRYL